jgi:hypothetical protein
VKKTRIFLTSLFVLCAIIACNKKDEDFNQKTRSVSTTIHDEVNMNIYGKNNYPDYIPILDNKTFDFSTSSDNNSYWTEENGQIAVYIKNILPNNLNNTLILYFDKNSTNKYYFDNQNIHTIKVQTWQVLKQVSNDNSLKSISLIDRPISADINLTLTNNKVSGSISNLKVYTDFYQNFTYDGTIPQVILISSTLKGTSYRTYSNITINNLNKQ